MRVRAKTLGIHGGRRWRKGEIFEIPKGDKADWMEPWGEKEAAKAAKDEASKAPEAATMSDVAKGRGVKPST